jgi:hypothetical protein
MEDFTADSVRKASSLANSGLLSKAARTLESAPLAPRSVTTAEHLGELRPRREVPAVSQQDPQGRTADIPAQTIVQAIKRAPKRSAPGVTGWRYEHLQALLPVSGEFEIPCAIALLTDILKARLPESIKDLLRIGILFAIAKSNGGIRPVAVTDVLRRVITKAIATHYKMNWGEAVGDLQYGVSIPAGSECVVKTCQVYLDLFPDQHAIVSADAQNAFNAADRQQMLDRLFDHFPELASFFAQWYDGEPPLWFRLESGDVHIIRSSQGSQQGDPAGGFLFCIGFRPHLEAIAHNLPQEGHPVVAAFFDDVYVLISHAVVPSAIDLVGHHFLAYGVTLVISKSAVYTPPSSSPLPASRLFPGIISTQSGIKILGIPVGSVDFAREFLQDHNESKAKAMNLLPTMDNKQAALLLLRYCYQPSFNHFLRCLPPSNPALREGTISHDSKLLDIFQQIFSLDHLHPSTASQIRLPVSLGGMGLLSSASVVESAFFASTAQALRLMQLRQSPDSPLHPTLQNCQSMENLELVRFARVAWTIIQLQTSRVPSPITSPPFSVQRMLDLDHKGFQHKLSELVHQTTLEFILGDVPAATSARIRSCGGAGSGAFLQAIPVVRGCLMSNTELTIAVKTRLGLDLSVPPGGRCACGRALDSNGHHFFLCGHGGDWQSRHTVLCQVWASIIRETGCAVSSEVPVLSLSLPSTFSEIDSTRFRSRRFDIVSVSCSSNNPSTSADVSITHPVSESHVVANSRQDGAAAAVRSAAKRRRYKSISERLGYLFVPLIHETYGRAAPEADAYLHRLATAFAARYCTADISLSNMISMVLHRWRVRLSVALQRSNARLIMRKLHAATLSNVRGSIPRVPDISSIMQRDRV